jgi:hypothetical protein
MHCNDIEWLVDMLGTMELLGRVINDEDESFPVVDVSARGQERSDFKASAVADGLYFDGAHWYSIRDGNKSDSYTMGYQVPGTAHFCQTFAAMIFKGEDANLLKPKEYAYNIRVALLFWIGFFRKYPAFSNWLLPQMKKSAHINRHPILKDMDHDGLIAFLVQVHDNAGDFVNCKQG